MKNASQSWSVLQNAYPAIFVVPFIRYKRCRDKKDR